MTASLNLCACALLELNPLLVLPVTANASGESTLPIAIPGSTPLGTAALFQQVWNHTNCCLTATNDQRARDHGQVAVRQHSFRRLPTLQGLGHINPEGMPLR